MLLPNSRHFNLFNLLFVKLYDSGELYKKLLKESHIYYEVLDSNDRNALDRGFIIKIFDCCIWFRKWKTGHQAQDGLSDVEISLVVDKLIKIHNLKIPEALLKELPSTSGMLTWFDQILGTSLALEWQILNESNSEPWCIVHGDFQPKKHVIKSNEKIEIIDFGDALIGWPSVDLGAIACSNPEILEKVLSAYNTKISRPISIEMVNFWKKYFELSNTFWMNHKSIKDQS